MNTVTISKRLIPVEHIALVERYGWLPSEILAEDEYWINRVLFNLEARARAARK